MLQFLRLIALDPHISPKELPIAQDVIAQETKICALLSLRICAYFVKNK